MQRGLKGTLSSLHESMSMGAKSDAMMTHENEPDREPQRQVAPRPQRPLIAKTTMQELGLAIQVKAFKHSVEGGMPIALAPWR